METSRTDSNVCNIIHFDCLHMPTGKVILIEELINIGSEVIEILFNLFTRLKI